MLLDEDQRQHILILILINSISWTISTSLLSYHASFATNLTGSKYDMQFYNTALDICSYALLSYVLNFKLNVTLATDWQSVEQTR